ncbi:MAG TPA: MBL fold metallo-hydrolase [Chthoniobacteraceae bacterium]|jgi:ribonuclease Z|nr:MBL fold metallo-hydrolase [Chthoniobacteraceae bacterium]
MSARQARKRSSPLPAARKRPIPETLLALLGTGTPIPDPDASGPAFAVVRGGVSYLVDCGPGIVRRAMSAAEAGVPGLAPPQLTRLFITHLHSDHTAGLADLMLIPWVVGRSTPLEIYGPPGTRNMVGHILAAYSEDIAIRVNGLEHGDLRAVTPVVHEFKPGLVYRDSQMKVRAFRVRHGTWPQAFGFRFESADRTIVLSGDTRPFPGLERHYKGADVLAHEAYCHAGFMRRTTDWRKYHGAFHTSTVQLAKMANAVKPGLLVMVHQLLFGETPETMLAELQKRYKGPAIYGRDLMVM